MPKADPRLIVKLNQILAQEYAAFHQYSAHKARYVNLQLWALVEYIEERIADERKHIEKLLNRILYLRGAPVVNRTDVVNAVADVLGSFRADANSEELAIKTYNEAIALAVELGDDGTRKVLEDNLADEEDHLDDLQAKEDQVALVGAQNFLAQQFGEPPAAD